MEEVVAAEEEVVALSYYSGGAMVAVVEALENVDLVEEVELEAWEEEALEEGAKLQEAVEEASVSELMYSKDSLHP